MFQYVTAAVAGTVVLVLLAMTTFLLVQAWPAVRTAGGEFLTERQWFPDATPPRFGIAALLWGLSLIHI